MSLKFGMVSLKRLIVLRPLLSGVVRLQKQVSDDDSFSSNWQLFFLFERMCGMTAGAASYCIHALPPIRYKENLFS